MGKEIVVAFVAGLFGLIPFIAQLISTRAQRRDRMTRLNHLRAELELLERLNAVQGRVSSGDKAAIPEMNLTINNALIKLLKQYTSLSEIAPRAVAGEKPLSPRELSFLRRVLLLYHPNTALSWILHTAFYILCFFVVAFFLIVVAVPPYHIDYLIGWAVIVAPIVPVLLIIQWLARRHTAHSEDTENPAILVHQD